jgi:plasmid stabilization system protein ParE
LVNIFYSKLALTDLNRITDFLLAQQPGAVHPTLDLIDEAISLLVRHPLIGRSVEAGLRELVISHGRSGYVALYSFEQAHGLVNILALRHQRESGFDFELQEPDSAE